MAMPNATCNIEKLTDTNYESWKIQMRSVLVVNDLWGYVSGEIAPTEASQAEWKQKDRKTLALITLSRSQNQITHIKKAETSAEAWIELEKVHESNPYSTVHCSYIAATLQHCKLQCNITKTLQR